MEEKPPLTHEKKCPKCNSMDVAFRGGSVGTGVGERVPVADKHWFQCRTCGQDFWYRGQHP